MLRSRLPTLRFGGALLLASGISLAASLAPGAAPEIAREQQRESPHVAAAPLRIPLPEGHWRVSRGIAAPWLTTTEPAPDTRAWLGASITLETTRLSAPSGLGCVNARYETDLRPPRGLFQGSLPAPAAAAAATLALTTLPVPSVSLACDTGLFDFHWATPQALLFARDNVIWVLDRSPGALAADGTPELAVQRLLEAHFAGDMGFDATTAATQRQRLSTRLQQDIDRYFARPFPPDEVPPINGDPFTDSQEYPVLFSVGTADRSAGSTRVPVRYDDGYRTRRVEFVLVPGADGWKLDDVRYEEGHTLRAMLTEN